MPSREAVLEIVAREKALIARLEGEHEQARTRLRPPERDLTPVAPSFTAWELYACRDAATRIGSAREVYHYEDLGFVKLGRVAAFLEGRLKVGFVSRWTHRAARGGSRSAAR
jgi:hypothetical protein